MYYNPYLTETEIYIISQDYCQLECQRFYSDSISLNSLQASLRNLYRIEKYQAWRIMAKIRKDFLSKGFMVRNNYINSGVPNTEYHYDVNKINEYFNINARVNNNGNIRNQLVSQSLSSDIVNALHYSDIPLAHKAQHILAYNTSKAYSIKNNRHFTITKTGEMRFTPRHKKTELNNDGYWVNNKFRQTIKYGKAFKQIFAHESMVLNDQFYEKLGNVLKGKYTFSAHIEIVKGEDIRKWYNGANYAEGNTESLRSSCMRHDYCMPYMDIYVENTDNVSMIIARQADDKIIGRAILWKLDDGRMFCDRIYGNDVTIENLKKYAQDNSYLVKRRQTYSDASVLTTTGEVLNDTFTITLKRPESRLYPYMDTMKYTDDCLETAKYLTLNTDSGDNALDSTDGGPNGEDYVETQCGTRVHRDDAVYIDNEDTWYHANDCIYSDYYQEYIVSDDSMCIYGGDYVNANDDEFTEAADTGEIHLRDDLTYSEYDSEYYHENYAECVVHGIISSDDLTTIEYNGEQFECHDSVDAEDLIDAGVVEREVEVE